MNEAVLCQLYGGGQGIGFAIAEALGRRGLAVGINDLRPAAAASAAQRLKGMSIDAVALPGDVSKSADVETSLRSCIVTSASSMSWSTMRASCAPLRSRKPPRTSGIL